MHAATTDQAKIRASALLFSWGLLSCLALSAYAGGPFDDRLQNPLASEFKSLDANHDGVLSRKESCHDSDIGSGFGATDRNHDGKIDEEEYLTRKTELQQAQMKAFLDDSSITAQVKIALLQDDGIHGLAISVETHQGIVTLGGSVRNRLQVHRAVEIASGIRGVVNVKNNLSIQI